MLEGLRRWFTKPAPKSAGKRNASPALAAEVAVAPAPQAPCDPANPLLGVLEQDYFALLMGVEAIADRPLIRLEYQAIETLIQLVKDPASLSGQVPRLPALLPKLMQSLHDRHKSGKELAKLIRSDPVVVAEVLRTANSPYYRTRNKIRDIEHAIVVLGTGGLRETVARIAVRPVVQFDSGLYNQTFAPRIWEQANKCASVCASLAPRLGVDRFDAFLAGLMHNVGAPVAFRVMSRMLGKAPPPACETFRLALTAVLPHLTYRVTREWALPEAVVRALRPKETALPLSQVVQTAARLAKLHTLVEAQRYLPQVYEDSWVCVPQLSASQALCLEELDRTGLLLGGAP